MIAFAKLFARLDETTRTTEKVAALRDYFQTAEPADAAWVTYLLSGNRIKRRVTTTDLRTWATEEAGIEDWLFQECYDAVADLAETIALVVDQKDDPHPRPLHQWITTHVLGLDDHEEAVRRSLVVEAWRGLPDDARFLYNKLLTGAFRVGVSRGLVTRALAEVAGVDKAALAHKLMGDWEPTAAAYLNLLDPDTETDRATPFPFCLAHPAPTDPARLGPTEAFLVEHKLDGIRAQLIRREGETFIWTRGEELVTDRYPEIAEAAASLPDGTVLDGEILAWRDGAALPFQLLQKRIGRKTVSRATLREIPVALVAFDLLEDGGRDIRSRTALERRARLDALADRFPERIAVTRLVQEPSWEGLGLIRDDARSRGDEGLMLKAASAPYASGRVRGTWWKWKVDPLTVDAVVTAAQRGSGRRASLYSDYTFALWDNDTLVTVAKAYTGLSDDEIRRVDRVIRRTERERFGPVRTVEPTLVMELAFERVLPSPRHKSGLAVRFPRILRIRDDKRPEDADSVDTLRAMISPADLL
ncbi:MAG: ATP-dependent DNA ligase [Bacteroidota bacterium]